MEYELSLQKRQWQLTLREFCQRELRPQARQRDSEQRFPIDVLPKLSELGLFGVVVPTEYGGLGEDFLTLAIAIEELARVDGSLALTIASHNCLALQHIVMAGSPEQKERYLPRAARGEWLAAWALTEPHAGSDSAAIVTSARRAAAGWALSGRKSFVSQGSVAEFCVVMAKTSNGNAVRGWTAFLVDRGTSGFSVSRTIGKYGCRASDTAELVFDNCCLDDDRRLGNVGDGFYDAMRILDRGRIAIAAMALGIGRAAHEAAVEYAGHRQTFGRTLAQHQAVQFMCADARTGLDAAELLIRRAIDRMQRGEAFSGEAAMAKLFASECATRVCNDAMQIHGGLGYTTECDVERHLRDAKLCEIAEGASEIQRMIIAKHLFRRGAGP